MSTQPESTDRRHLLQNALAALEKMQAKLDAVERARREPIAIIGMSGRFPGANSPAELWALLERGGSGVREVPPDRWDIDAYYDPDPKTPGKMCARNAGFLDRVDLFDPRFFGISPREAMTLDPQQRLLLEVTWEALENAGQAPDQLAGSQTGVFVGITSSEYASLLNVGDPESSDVYSATGTALNAAAGRLSFVLGLQGPCVSVDTACSSSLVAIHQACQSLRTGESELAIAGGVNVILSPTASVLFSKWGMLAPDGCCKTFDAAADGFVRGEGCGVLILKRLSDATAHGDRILALIRGDASNQDGASSGLSVPNGIAQAAVIRRALAMGEINPADVDFIEAHGTGTSLGDPIEVEALGKVFGKGRAKDRPLAIGSIKTNLGHLESASGVAGLIKLVLALQHEAIPAHLHLKQLSPRIPWDRWPVVVPTKLTPWPAGDRPRIAGVSSFGFTGTNAHIVLQEAPRRPAAVPNDPERPLHLLTLSAKSEPALKQLAARYGEQLAAPPAIQLADVCYSAGTGRAQLPHRLAVRAESAAQVKEALAKFVAGEEAPGLWSGRPESSDPPKIAFLFTGQGSQYPGMGRQLYATQPVFRQTLDRCGEVLQPLLQRSLTSILYPAAGEEALVHETRFTQPALFALEYSLAALWRSWGLEPSIVLGHSVGEYVAACVAGMFSLEDGLKLIAERARLMQALPAGGRMAAIFADEARVARALAPFASELSIAAINGPQNIVIAGAGAALEKVAQEFTAAGVKVTNLTVSHAFHSPLMEPMLAEFERAAASVRFAEPQLALIANATGLLARPGEMTRAEYWRNHVRQPVRFAASMATLTQLGCELFVELGPSPLLLGMGRRCLPESQALWLPTLRPNRDDWPQLLETLAQLYLKGARVDWEGFDRPYRRQRVTLPTYPFQRERHWVEAKTTRPATTADSLRSRSHPLLGTRIDLGGEAGRHLWQGEINTRLFPWLSDHRVQGDVIVPATAYVEMGMAAVTEVCGPGPLVATEVENRKALILSDGLSPTVQVALQVIAPGEATFQVFSRIESASTVNPEWILNVTGKICFGQPELSPKAPEQTALADVRARCGEEISGAEFYRRMAEKGNQWGPCFQGIERLWRTAGEGVSRVLAPAALHGELPAYLVHPAVADAAGHILTATISLDKSADSRGGAFVGGGIDEVRFYKRPASGRLWAHARLRDHAGLNANILRGDVRMLDDDGTLVAEVIGARLYYLENNAPAVSVDNWFYEPRWLPAPLPVAVAAPASTDAAAAPTWLIFTDAHGIGDALAGRLRAAGRRCVQISAAENYVQTGSDAFTIRVDQSEDYAQLLAAIVGADGAPVAGIVHLWSVEAAPAATTTPAALEDALVRGCASVMRLIQQLKTRPGASPKLWLVTQGTQSVAAHPGVATVASATLWGFGRTLATEHAELWGGLIDLESGAPADTAAKLLAGELLSPGTDDQLAFRQGERFGLRLVRHRPARARANAVRWRLDGSYLITGGLGGLGLKVAHWMAQQGARRLILMGRTPPPPRADWGRLRADERWGKLITAILEIERLGACVQLAPVDVGDEGQLAAFLKQFRAEGWPPIRGVVHAAGIMQYQSLLEHSAEQMRAIMRAKVVGAWLLHQCLTDVPLDFFVVFSSASALLSSPLLASYAGANTFLDALAYHRRARGLAALSINWGLWSEVGMGAKFEAGTADRNAGATKGAGTIAPAQGLEAFARLLAQDAAQVSVLTINWPQWAKLYPAFTRAPLLAELVGGATADSSGSGPARLTRGAVAAAEPGERPPLIESYLAAQIAKVLGLDETKLDRRESISALGLDSLMAVELKNRIENDLNVVIPVVKFLQGPTVVSLAGLVAQGLAESADGASAEQPPRSAPAHEAADLLTQLPGLSEAEVEALLAKLDDESARPD